MGGSLGHGHGHNRFTVLPLFILFICLMGAAGCGIHYNEGSAAPQPSNPTQAPPTTAQHGSVEISPQYAALAPGQSLAFSATVQGQEPAKGALQWQVNGIPGGNAHVGVVDASGRFTAPAHAASGNVTVTAALGSSPQADYATAVASVIGPGTITPTANPQVVTYTVSLPEPGTVSVDFGLDTNYAQTTWSQPAPPPYGGQVSLYVAGMRSSTLYHLRAHVVLADGADFQSPDQTFLSGVAPKTASAQVSATPGQSPQPGIELFDTVIPQEKAQLYATDIQGNVIWTYGLSDGSAMDAIQPAQLLPNGDFLLLISYLSSLPINGTTLLPNTIDVIREIDLAGKTIREVTESQVAAALEAKGYNLQLGSFHHDVLVLPNGHWIVLLSDYRTYQNLPGSSGATKVLGDVLVDLDQNNQPVWVWDAFDHLDINRHPYLFPDWTHSNSLFYSADDHDLLLSMRHQNWVIKIDYEDGQGSGRVLWRLGEGGDFKLIGGSDPADWFYAQHGPDFFSPNTSGVFRLGVMDNGDDRPAASGGGLCGAINGTACYSSVPVYQIDESAMTATLLYRYSLSPKLYSFFGGDVQSLANGDALAAFSASAGGTVVQELKLSPSSQQLVWQAVTPGATQYRVTHLPSLYPGVQW